MLLNRSELLLVWMFIKMDERLFHHDMELFEILEIIIVGQKIVIRNFTSQ
jgi:hypothetical protein